MNNELKVGTTLSWEEVTYRISAIKLDLGDIRLEAKGGLEKTLDRHDFFNKIASGEIQIDGYRPFSMACLVTSHGQKKRRCYNAFARRVGTDARAGER